MNKMVLSFIYQDDGEKDQIRIIGYKSMTQYMYVLKEENKTKGRKEQIEI